MACVQTTPSFLRNLLTISKEGKGKEDRQPGHAQESVRTRHPVSPGKSSTRMLSAALIRSQHDITTLFIYVILEN